MVTSSSFFENAVTEVERHACEQAETFPYATGDVTDPEGIPASIARGGGPPRS